MIVHNFYLVILSYLYNQKVTIKSSNKVMPKLKLSIYFRRILSITTNILTIKTIKMIYNTLQIKLNNQDILKLNKKRPYSLKGTYNKS